MVAEFKELGERAGKLEKFIESNPMFGTLDETEQALQIKQLGAMRDYQGWLYARLRHQGITV